MNWSKSTLGELAFFQRGFDITKKEQEEGEYPVVSSSGIQSFHSKATVQGPGVVIGCKGTLGSVFYIESDFWAHDTTLWVKDFQGNNPRFVYYFLKTLDLGKFDSGGANPTLNRNHIHGIQILKPLVQTQERIADVLSNYDRLIDNNTRRIALLESSIHRLYQEWFVHLRFPGCKKGAIVDGVPEGWELIQLSEIASVNQRTISARNAPEKIQYVDISSVTTGNICGVQLVKLVDAPSRAKRVVTHGDVIWSMVRPGRRAYSLVLNPPENLIASTGFAVLSAKEIPYSFLYQAVTTDSFVSHMENVATGAAYPAVKPKDFESMPLLVPDENLLNKFDELATFINQQIHNLHLQNDRLREARDLLLPRLMNGSIAL